MQISAPQQVHVQPGTRPPVDSVAMTQEDLLSHPVAMPSHETPAVEQSDTGQDAVPDRFVALQPADPFEPAEAVSPDFYGSSSSWNIPSRANPTDSWTSPHTNRTRQFVLVGFLGATSLVAAAALFIVFLRWYGTPTPSDVPVAQALLEQRLPAATSNPETDADSEIEPDPRSLAAENEVNATAVDEPSTEEDSIVVNDPPSADTVQDASDVDSAPSEPSLQPPLDPVVNDALPDAEPPNAAGGAIAVEQPKVELPKRLQELYNLIGQPMEITIPQQLVVPDRAPVTAEELGLSSQRVDRSLPPVDLHVVASQRELRGLRLDKVSLSRAANVWSLVTGIPTVVDLQSLSAAGLDRNATIDLRLQSVMADKAAEQLALAAGLKIQAIENRFWRLYAPAPDAQRLPWQMTIEDLLPQPDEHDWLVTALERLLPGLKGAMAVVAGELVCEAGKCDVRDWFAALRLLENWRSLSRKPSQLSQYEPNILQAPLTTAKLLPGLERELTEKNVAQRPLASFLNLICTQAEINCWVDWPALAETGLGPHTAISSVTYKRRLAAVLKELEFEYGVVVALIDSQTVWLTSPAVYRQSAGLFVLPSQGKDLQDYWLQWLRPLTPTTPTGVSQTEIQLSPDQQVVLVKCCYPNLQFRD
ncbi:MAG: hypothetical protein KF752_03230 [Pirellulaceae bacterium]|nr:hypothetical protein [Pirellulaceae bacterium]